MDQEPQASSDLCGAFGARILEYLTIPGLVGSSSQKRALYLSTCRAATCQEDMYGGWGYLRAPSDGVMSCGGRCTFVRRLDSLSETVGLCVTYF